MRPNFAILSLVLPAMVAAQTLPGQAESPAQADAATITDQLMPLLAARDVAIRRAAVEAAVTEQIATLAGEPNLPGAAQAVGQAAQLAMTAQNPATRAVMADLTIDLMITAQSRAGRDDAVVTAWSKADPMIDEVTTGLGLAQSDIDGAATLRRLAGEDAAGADKATRATWAKLVDSPVELVLPSRLNAWAAGVEAAWPQLSAGERAEAVAIFDAPALPSPELSEKVTGTPDLIWWLASVDLPMTEAERAAAPDLVMLAEAGAFSGPLSQPLAEMAAQQAALSQMADPNSMTNQLKRLNDHAIVTGGDMWSWDAQRYMRMGW